MQLFCPEGSGWVMTSLLSLCKDKLLLCCHCNCLSMLTSRYWHFDVCLAGGYDGYFKHSAAAAASAASSSGTLLLPTAMMAQIPVESLIAIILMHLVLCFWDGLWLEVWAANYTCTMLAVHPVVIHACYWLSFVLTTQSHVCTIRAMMQCADGQPSCLRK